MFYTHTITTKRLNDIFNQLQCKKTTIDICGQEISILFSMPLSIKNTKKKALILLLREHFHAYKA